MGSLVRENAVVRKLSRYLDMTDGERAAVESWCQTPSKYRARQFLVKEGDRPDNVRMLLTGWACGFVDTKGGKRQIVGLLLPGDICDGHASLLRRADHNVALLTDASVASVSPQRLARTTADHPRLAQALWWSSQLDEGITRHWLVNVGRRDAVSRTAHLLCELWVRAQMIGLIPAGQLIVPLTQQDLADALGMTSVHMNRVIRVLREAKLITFCNRELTLTNFDALARRAEFDPTYLQLERRPGVART